MAINLEISKAKTLSKVKFNPKEQLLEVSVFLFLIAPSLILSFFVVKQGDMSFVLTAVSTILRDLALVSLILFFLWRNRESIRQSLGWTLKNSWKEVLLGVGLFVPVTFGTAWLDRFLQTVGFSAPATPQPSFLAAAGLGEFILAFFLVLIVAVAEETIFRGYLILRFSAIAGSRTVAVLVSTVIFSLGHGYEGTAGVITVGVLGLTFALVYVWRKSLVAPVVMHFLQDFIGIILLPLLGFG
jgi:membrane protease YdiL (CAAX protease family)